MSKKQKGPQLRYVDIPELPETFADSLEGMTFDGNIMKITLTVTRWNEPKPPDPPSGKKYPSCRLALTAACVEELHQKLNQLAASLDDARAQESSVGKTIQ